MFSLVLSHNKRSKEYLKIFKKNKIFFDYIFIYNVSQNHLYPYCKKLFLYKKKKLDKNLKKIILKKKIKNLIINPGDGEIINKEITKELNLFHCHPGKLPDFKGSAVIYYSLLEKNKIFCTIFRISSEIDRGKIMFQQEHKIPNWKKINYINFDNQIRAKTLLNFLKKNRNIIFKSKNSKSPNYYIPHPVLRYFSLNKLKLKNDLKRLTTKFSF